MKRYVALAKKVLGLFSIATLVACSKAANYDRASTSGGSASGPIAILFTSPTADSTITQSTQNFTWTAVGTGTVRSTNSYQLRTYGLAACAGTPLSTAMINSNSTLVSGISDAKVISIGVSAYSTSDVLNPETCSSTITGQGTVSMLQVQAGGNYLSLDVDFTNQVAYMGAAYGTTGLDAVEFSAEGSPTFLRSFGSTTTPSSSVTASRGVALYNNGQRMIIASNGASLIELWDLTGNPRTGTWTKLGTMGGLSGARKIAKVDTSNPTQTVVYVALRSGIAIVNIAEPSGAMTLVGINTGYSNCLGNGAIIGGWMLSGCYYGGSSAQLINLTTLNSDATYPFPDPGTGTNIWGSAVSADGTKAFVGGLVGGFFTYDLSTPAVPPVNSYRFNMNGTGACVRDAVFVTENGKTLLYTIDNSPMRIDVWDVTSATTPVQIAQQSLNGGTNEAYSIRVDPVAHRAYVGTSGGQIFIVNTQMLGPVVANYPTY